MEKKLEELSIADLKAIKDYGENILNNERGHEEDVIDFWLETVESAEILIEARIKKIFK